MIGRAIRAARRSFAGLFGQRGYAAAQDHRASAWAPAGGSATAEVGMASATIARRARDAVRNDPYAARIVDLWTGNAVGAGITTRWPDDAHGRAWQRWAESTACDAEGRLDLYGLQALVMRAVVESGECFVRFLPTEPAPANPIGLRLQVLESDHLDAARNGVKDRIAWMSRQFNSSGEHLGYRYVDSPSIVPDGTPEPPDDPNQVVPSTWPGSRMPVAWLADGRSTLDLLGPGFTLLCAGMEPAAPGLLAALAGAGCRTAWCVATRTCWAGRCCCWCGRLAMSGGAARTIRATRERSSRG